MSRRQLIVNKIHRPGLVRPRRRPAIIPQLGLNPALRRFVAQLQAQLAIDAPRLVLATAPTFTTQQDVNAAVAVANARMADLLDPMFEGSLAGATRLVMVGRPVKLERRAGPADRDLPLATDFVDQLALPASFIAFGGSHPAASPCRATNRRPTSSTSRSRPL